MSNVLIALGLTTWFALLFPFAMQRLAVVRPPENGPLAVPLVLVTLFAFALFIFNVPRGDGTAVLQEGLSASNVMTIVISITAMLYLCAVLLTRRTVALLPFAAGYRPYAIMILYDFASTGWSIVPQYTLYRSAELATYFVLTLLVFDRADVERRIASILTFYILVWLAIVTPTIAANLAIGIVFSSAKNNTMPLVCATLMLSALFAPGIAHRKALACIGLVAFVIAGSASSTGALLCAVPPACLIASPRRGLRIAGFVLGAVIVLVFAFLVVGLSAFPELVDVLSVVLQKPPVELENATGRASFWPIFIAATRDHMFGSGFSAADRFLQLIVPPGALPDVYARDEINIGNSHNMFLSAWAATGIVGLGFAVTVLGSAIRRALRLGAGGRRFVLSAIFMLILNGLTTPGIFQDWGPMAFAFLAVLAYTRMGLGDAAASGAPSTARAAQRVPRPVAFGFRRGGGEGVQPLRRGAHRAARTMLPPRSR